MDLYAYAQIGDLSEVAKANGIEVPRLRGYRLMSQEDAIPNDEIREIIHERELKVCENACCAVPRFSSHPCFHEYSYRTEQIQKQYLVYDDVPDRFGDGTCRKVVGFNWNLLHGKTKKRLKLAVKHAKRDVVRNLGTFNKYAGRDDVLYIHARIGGGNWVRCGGKEIEKQPWFIEKADDYFDPTYCDIYARISKETE